MKYHKILDLHRSSIITMTKKTIFILFALMQIQTFAQTSSVITVNYAVDEGPSNQVASGLLHGISANHPAQYLIDGIKVNSVRGTDHLYGTYLPEYFDSATYYRTKATGAKLMIGLYYYKGTNSYRPGDGGDWDTWRNIVAGVYNEAQSKNYDIYSWITWNEPRLQWSNLDTYKEAHRVAYEKIKSLNPSAKIQAPEDHAYDYTFMTGFLTFCKNNNCLPDILSWHELSENPLDIEGHCSQIKTWMESNGIIPMPFAITEYQGASYSNDNTSIPGVNVYYLASLERSVKYGFAFGLHACWSWLGGDANFIATLADMANKDGANLPRGLWWNYNAYKDMTGRLVQVTVSGANSDAFASYDSVMKKSIALIGTRNYVTPHNVTLNMNNIPDKLAYNNKVNIRVDEVPDGMVVMSPVVKLDADYTVSGNSVSVTLPTMTPKSSYIVYISPATNERMKLSFEAESLNATYSPGKHFDTIADASASNGKLIEYKSAISGDFVEYSVPGLEPGYYYLTGRLKQSNNYGFLQLYINGKSTGQPEDEYASGSVLYYDNDFGIIKVDTGNLNLKFVVVGKNSSSSNYWMGFDRFDLINLTDATTNIPQPKNKKSGENGIEAVLFPNPVTAGYNLDIDIVYPEDGIKTIEIANIQGQIVYKKTTLSNKIQFAADNLKKGLYFVTISTAVNKKSYKIIVE